MGPMKSRVGRWAPVLLVPTLVLALAGCSGDDEGDEGGAGPETPSGSAEATASGSATAPAISPADLEDLPEVRQSTGAVKDITWDQTTCSTSPGEQTTGGTLTNPTDARTGYLVSISWTTDGGDTLARGFQVVRGARPGDEVEWEVTAEVPEGATQCVPFVQRGVIQK